jgi:hypothetical protein
MLLSDAVRSKARSASADIRLCTILNNRHYELVTIKSNREGEDSSI